MWRTEFDYLCLKQALQNEQAGVPTGNYIDVSQQILCNPVIFQQV
jgi:hypothetical protein